MNRFRKLYLVVAALTAILLIGSVLAQMALGTASHEDEVPKPEAHFTYTEEGIATNIAAAQASETAEIEHMEAASRGEYGELPSKDSYTPPPTESPAPVADPDQPGAIIENYQPMAGDGGDYVWSNGWGGMIDGHHITAAVGGSLSTVKSKESLVQGVVRVTGDDAMLYGVYLAPEGEGTLRIVSAKRYCLELIAVDSGQSLQFDLYKRTWECSE